MSLFANERAANLESTVAMVQDVLIELGHYVSDCRRNRANSVHAWTIRKGSASIAIDLLERPEFWRVRVSAIVMTLDARVDKVALYQELLSLNAVHVTGAAFALEEAEVLLVSERSTLDLDRSELRDLVSVVRNFADDYDDKLVDKFGGTRGSITGDEASPPAPVS